MYRKSAIIKSASYCITSVFYLTLYCDARKHKVEISVVLLQDFCCCEMFLIHIAGSRPAVRGGAPVTNLDVPTTSLQNPKDKHTDKPDKTCANILHPRVALVEGPRLETAR